MYNTIHSEIYIQASQHCSNSRVHILCSSPSQSDRIIRRLDLLRILDPTLLPDLIHRLHDNNTLLPPHHRTLQFPLPKEKNPHQQAASSRTTQTATRDLLPDPHNSLTHETKQNRRKEREKRGSTHIPNTPPTLIRLPKHAMPRYPTLHLPHPPIRPLPHALRIPILARGDEPIARGSERGPVDLHLPFGPLDANGRSGGVEAVGIGRDAEVCEGDAVGGVGAARGGGEGEEDGGFFVGAGGVSFDGGEDGGGLAVRGWDGVVEGLEAPGERVDADWFRGLLQVSMW